MSMNPGLTFCALCLLAAPAAWCQPQDALRARNLAATCANCHGTAGHATGEMASLAGRPAEALLSQLAAFRSGAQPATLMHQIAKGYTDEQLRLIAGFYAAQPARP
jgi:cytochrome subunit of sulfide dehydrogenase